MSKIVKTVIVVAIAVAVVVFAPQIAAVLASVAGSLGVTVAATAISSALIGMGISMALTAAATLFRKAPSMSQSMVDRLNTSVVATASRKIIFGTTAGGADVRFFEGDLDLPSTKKDGYVQVVALASHRINALKQFYVENDLVWQNGSFVSKRNGFAPNNPFRVVTEGNPGNGFSVGSGRYWNSASTFTGCAYYVPFWKLDTDVWESGIPQRLTAIVEGCPLYDPRRDSTRGGSGAHRVNDQNTYAFRDGATEIGRNPALALLTYLLGWRINGKVVWGMGIPANRIDFDNFRTYANLCEEGVAVQGGGTVQRYTADGIFSTTDSHETVINGLTAAMGSCKLTDRGGTYCIVGGYDDTAGPKVAFDADDLVAPANGSSPYIWNPAPASRERFNIVRGRFANPEELYQLTDWGDPIEREPLADGIPRTMSIDLGAVSRAETCQRIAKQMLLREYLCPGMFAATFGPKAFAVEIGSVITLSLPAEGWNNKLFRVMEQAESHDLFFQMTLREEDPAIYAWDREEKPLPAMIRPQGYDASTTIVPANLALTSASYSGANGVNVSEVHVTWTPELSGRVNGIQIQSRPAGTDAWSEQAALFDPKIGMFTFTSNAPGITVEVRARFRMMSAVYSPWVNASVATAEVITITDWENVTDTSGTRPADNATVGAPVGTNVGDRPVVTLLQDTDKAKADASAALGAVKDDAGRVIVVKDLLASVADLEDVFGNTDSAGVARDAALAARDQSQAARDAAQAASTTAGDFAGQAEASKNLSQTAQSAAADAKTAAEAAKAAAAKSVTDASGFASTATGQADIATQKASDAGSFASNASGSAATANTKAGEASASATQALTSKTDAAGSATSASQSATLSASSSDAAGKALALQFPKAVSAQIFMVDPASNVLTSQSFINPSAVNNGKVVMNTVNPPIYPYGLWMRGYLPYEAGKTYEVRARAEWVSGYPDTPAVIGYYNIYDATGALVGETTLGSGLTLPANTPTDYAARFTLPESASAKFIRFGLLTNRKPTNLGALTVGRTDIHTLYPVDVTDSVASKASADASSASASAANVSAGLAGTRATAADTSRQQAVTSAGEALAYRNTAATSASTATDAATSATQSSGVAARAALDGSANSANDNRSPGAALSLWSYNDYNSMAPAGRLTAEPAVFSSVSGQLRITGAAAVHLHPVAPVRIQPGKRYRSYVRFRILADGPQPSGHYLYTTFFDANGSLLAGNTIAMSAISSTTVSAGWVELSRDFSTDGSGNTYGAPLGAAFARVMYRSSGVTTEVALMYIEDMEAQLASAASATASSGSAAAALASQNAAGQNASAADGYKNLAQTASGAAETARASAATSASNALGSQNSAASSASLSATARDAATAVAAATLPSTFAQGDKFWSQNFGGLDNRPNNFPASFTTDPSTGVLTVFGSPATDVAHLGSVTLVRGRRRRLTARWLVADAAGAPNVSAIMYFIGLNAAGGAPTTPPFSISIPGGGPGWGDGSGYATHSFEVDDATLMDGGAVKVRGLFRYNQRGNEIWRLASLTLDDVTSENASKGFATASNNSASTAAASADLAGTRASAAETARIAAVTAKGSAESARDTAVTSKNDAAGSANSAAASATLSAKTGGTRGLTLNGDFAGPQGWSTALPYGDWYLGKGYRAGPGQAGDVRAAQMVQVDVTHKYRLSVRFAIHGVSAQIYAGLVCYDVNRNFIANVYIPAYSAVRYAGGVYSDTGEFSGATGPAGYGFGTTFAAGTVYVTPLALLNYAGDAVNVDIAALYLEDITSEVGARGSASAALSSAQSATASRDAAGNSAVAANQSRIDAQAANGTAQGAAGVANSAAAAADASRSQAQTSASLSASMSGGASNRNSNFANHNGGDQPPVYWLGWNTSPGYPLAQRAYGTANLAESGYTVEGSPYGYTSGNAINSPAGIYQDFGGSGGYYNVSVSIQLLDGAWNGSGILVYGFNANGFVISSAIVDFLNDPDAAGLKASQLSSSFQVRKFNKTIFLDGGADVKFMRVYAMTGWEAFTGTNSYKQMAWYKCAVITASSSERASGVNTARIENVNTVLANDIGSLGIRTNSVEARAGSLESRTGVTETAVTNLKTGQAAARIELQAVTPGGRAAVVIRSDNNAGAGIDLTGDVNFMGNLKIQKNTGGKTITIDSDTGITFNNGSVMKVSGIGFGSNNQFIEWVGPSLTSLSQCTEANAIQYIKTNGSAYFGGALSAGVLKNSVQTTSAAQDANVTTGTFGSNGKSRVVTVGYSANSNTNITGQCPTPYTPYATIRLYRGTNAQGTLLAEQQINGSHSCVAGAGQYEPGSMNDGIGGSFTYTDNTGGSSTSYFVQIVARSIMATNLQQSLGVTSVEQ